MFRLAFVAIVRLQSSSVNSSYNMLNPLNAELNPICNLLALLGAHPILHVSRVRVNMLDLIITLPLSILYKLLALLDCNLTMTTKAGRNM